MISRGENPSSPQKNSVRASKHSQQKEQDSDSTHKPAALPQTDAKRGYKRSHYGTGGKQGDLGTDLSTKRQPCAAGTAEPLREKRRTRMQSEPGARPRTLGRTTADEGSRPSPGKGRLSNRRCGETRGLAAQD